MADKLLAEWFWIDRWMGSSAFGLTMEAQGVYRAMLSQAWLRGAQLPNNPVTIRRFIGATPEEWHRCWPMIERSWKVRGDSLVNETQLEVYAEAHRRHHRASTKGKLGAQVREAKRQKETSGPEILAQVLPTIHHNGLSQDASQDASQDVSHDEPKTHPEMKPPSPSPSPSPDLEPSQSRVRTRTSSALAGTLPRDHVSHAWCSSRGKCVPEFLHVEFVKAIGGDEAAASQRLKVFYEAVERGWPEGTISDHPLQLWRREFAAKFPSVLPNVNSKTAGNDAALSRFIARHRGT